MKFPALPVLLLLLATVARAQDRSQACSMVIATGGIMGDAVVRGLEARGHVVKVVGPFSNDVGGGQAVMRDFASGVNYGASDPRKDGMVVPERAR